MGHLSGAFGLWYFRDQFCFLCLQSSAEIESELGRVVKELKEQQALLAVATKKASKIEIIGRTQKVQTLQKELRTTLQLLETRQEEEKRGLAAQTKAIIGLMNTIDKVTFRCAY